MHKIVLFSGGLDSLLTFRLYHPDATLLYINWGSPYHAMDYAAARTMADLLGKPLWEDMESLSLKPVEGSHIVLNRNLMLAAVASVQADIVYFSCPRGDIYSDTRTRFLRRLGATLSASLGRPVQVENALAGGTKVQHVARYLAQYSYDRVLAASRSCYEPIGLRCGVCPACMKRFVALRANGVKERFKEDPRKAIMDTVLAAPLTSAVHMPMRVMWETYKALRS